MTTRFFAGSHDSDADHLNTLLDAMRSGMHAPESASNNEEATDLAAAASTFRTLDDRGKAVAGVTDTTFDSIWEDMMSAHAIADPAPFTGAPPTRTERIDQRVIPIPPQAKISRLQSFFSAAIVAIMIAGLISAAWNLRGDTGGGGGGDERARLAATALDGTPEASPEAGVDDWWSWVTAEECVPEDFPEIAATDADLDSTDQYWSERYTPLSEPSMQGAVAVASVARQIEACKQAGVPFRSLETDRQYAGEALQDPNYLANYYRLSQEISDAYPITDPEEFVRTTIDQPVFATPSALMRGAGLVRAPTPFVFIPDQAVTLADGRIGIPAASLLGEGNPDSEARIDALERGVYLSNLLIFTDQSGEWQFDGELTLCIGECDAYWDYQALLFDLPATPNASPAAKIDWLSWMTPEECTVEPISQEDYAEIMRNEPVWPSHEYTVVGAPDPDMANAAATVAREHEACNTYRMTDQKLALESPSYIYVSNNGFVADASPQEQHLEFIQHSQELSAQLPNQDPQHYIAVSDEAGAPSSGFVGDVYLPENALLLSDGRIVIPATKLFASDPGDIFLPGGMIILTNESGEWRVDEGLNLCVGDCEDYWTKSMGPLATPAASPVASPVATPEE